MALNFTVSYTFSPSTTISSSQVNTNTSDVANVFNGLEAKTKTFSNLGIDTELKTGGSLLSANGTVAAPSISFTNSTGTGLYRIGADNLGIATGGVVAVDISSAQLVTLSNNIVFNPTTKGIKGTTAADDAAALNVGEYVVGTATSVTFPTSTQYGDATSISLTAGDWDVTGYIQAEVNTGVWSAAVCAISVTSGNSATGISAGLNRTNGGWTNASATPLTVPLGVGPYRLSLSGTTTVYLKMQATYTSGQPQVGACSIHARRVR